MSLKSYFDSHKGSGILSTVSKGGEVNSALYASPHVFEDGTLGFIMTNRLTYQNIQETQNAHYLFIQDGDGYSGKRLSLTKVGEENDPELIEPLRRRTYSKDREKQIKPLHLVLFRLDVERPLVGSGEAL